MKNNFDLHLNHINYKASLDLEIPLFRLTI